MYICIFILSYMNYFSITISIIIIKKSAVIKAVFSEFFNRIIVNGGSLLDLGNSYLYRTEINDRHAYNCIFPIVTCTLEKG